MACRVSGGLKTKAISDTIILKSWRDGTKKQCDSYLKRWWAQFCCERQINRAEVTVNDTLVFPTSLCKAGLKYSAINTARCALSYLHFDSRWTVGSHPLITRFLKGVYESRPIQSIYLPVWDVQDIFNMFRSWSTNEALSMRNLFQKTAMLISLVSAQRV